MSLRVQSILTIWRKILGSPQARESNTIGQIQQPFPVSETYHNPFVGKYLFT